MEELLEVVQGVFLAWEVLVSKKGKQIVGEPVAVKKQMCHQKDSSLCCFCIAFLLHSRLHHRPLKIPLLLIPPQGFPDLPFKASWLEKESSL